MIRLFLVAVALLLSGFSTEKEIIFNAGCTMPLHYRAGVLGTDFDRFQNGEGSWRAFASKGCLEEARELIEDYLEAHSETLTQGQRDELARSLQYLANQMSGPGTPTK